MCSNKIINVVIKSEKLNGVSSVPPLIQFHSPNLMETEAICDVGGAGSGSTMQADVKVLPVPSAGCQNEVLEMYKDLLRKESLFFKLLLEESVPTAEEIISQMDRNVLEVIRHVSHYDELPSNMTTHLQFALQVLEASFQYGLDRLLELTVTHLLITIKPETAFKILQSARAVECSKLEELALETIIRNPDQLLKNTDVLFLGCHDINRILSSDALSCKEFDVFQTAYSWALMQCRESPSANHSPSLKKYFGQVSMCIRYELMSLKELAEVTVATGDLLPPEESIKLFQRAFLPESKTVIPIKYSDKPRSGPFSQRTAHFVSMATQTEGDVTEEPQMETEPRQPSPIPEKNYSYSKEPPRRSVRLKPVAFCSSSISNATAETPPSKVMRVFDDQGISQVESEDDLFVPVKQIHRRDKVASTFEDAVRRYISKIEEKDRVTSIAFSNLTIEKKYKSILFQNCSELRIDAKCDFFQKSESGTSLLNFVSNFDPMRYLFCDTSGGLPMTPENIWELNQDILLKFNGVIFLKVDHLKKGQKEDTLVLNYVPHANKILHNSSTKVLALSNCEFSVKLIKERAKDLEKLTLYRVWGEFTLDEILRDLPNLKELSLWKHIPVNFFPGSDFSTPLSLNFSSLCATKHNIRKLALFGTELKFPIRCTSAAAGVTELVLDLCYYRDGGRNANITNVFHQVFPNLSKLVLLNDPKGKLYRDGNIPMGTPSLVNCAKKNLASLECILVRSMIWGENENEDTQLASFLEKKANLEGKPKNFRLEKMGKGSWKGERLDDSFQESQGIGGNQKCWSSKMEYDCYNLDYFYDSLESFEKYFIAKSFPNPILWT